MSLALVSPCYCSVCGTDHAGSTPCPGELRATGAETPGWRVLVETAAGRQTIGVLLAPSYERWRARIVTLPNVLWTIPGGRGTLKFVGNSREEAEAQAIRFVERHVLARRQGPRLTATPAFAVAARKTVTLPVRFGLDRAIVRGVTLNLSTDGLFVRVLTPEECGRFVLVHLDIRGHTHPARGMVMWNRLRGELQRPAGMGIRLSDPSILYQTFVDELP